MWDKGWGIVTDGTAAVSYGSSKEFPEIGWQETLAGDVLMFALDADAGHFYLGKNGTWLGEGDPASETNPTFEGLPKGLYAAVEIGSRDVTRLLSKPILDRTLLSTRRRRITRLD